MRGVVAVILTALGLFLLGGPAFGAVAWLAGGEVSVNGGPVRLTFDVLVGSLLVVLGARGFSASSSALT